MNLIALKLFTVEVDGKRTNDSHISIMVLGADLGDSFRGDVETSSGKKLGSSCMRFPYMSMRYANPGHQMQDRKLCISTCKYCLTTVILAEIVNGASLKADGYATGCRGCSTQLPYSRYICI